jgi:hypothetical protein
MGGARHGRARSLTTFILLAAALAGVSTAHSVETSASSMYQTTGQVIDVPAGGSLQAALNQVLPGGTVRLAPGATYVGNFKLPAKFGTEYITITTRDAVLPPPRRRIDPSYKPGLAVIRSPSTLSALTTAAGASYYRIVGVAFEANQHGAGDIITLGLATQTTLSQVPHHIEFDRVLISGHPTAGQKRGIAANATHFVITDSDIRDIKAVGQDSQAIFAWNTPGPFLIRNNYLEAAGENIMFGGTQVTIPDVVPSDITVEDNLLLKNPAWRGTSWTVKNLFELKNARRVSVRRNIMQYNWAGGQPGYAVVFTPRNPGGLNPWSVVEDVEFIGNIVSHTSSAFNLLGHDDHYSTRQLARILIKDNLFFDVSTAWGGAGTFAQIGGAPRDITIDHNTVLHSGNIVTFYSGRYPDANGVVITAGPVLGFVFTNNLLKHNAYGIMGSGQAYGNGTLSYYAPGAVVRRNVMATNSSLASRYPPDNLFPTVAFFNASFRGPGAFDYRLVAGSPYLNAGTDGRDIGCDFTVQTSVVRPGAPINVRVTR